jgi:S1-C subfamily serine protease
LERQLGRWNVVDTAIAVIGVSIGLIFAVVVAPRPVAQVAVAGASITRTGQSDAERMAGGAAVLVQSHECVPLWATGTVLRSGIVVTNAHLLGGGTTFDVVTADGRNHPTGHAQRSSDTDLATGAVPSGVPAVGLDLASADPRPGDQVVIAGHPGGGPLRIRTASVVGARPGRGPDDPPTIIRLDVHLLPGESGSPVVGQDGRLEGVAYSTEHGTGQALIIPASRIRHALTDVATATSRC